MPWRWAAVGPGAADWGLRVGPDPFLWLGCAEVAFV